MKIKFLNTLFLAGLFFSLGLTGCSTVRKHDNFAKRHGEFESVLVVQPEMLITRTVFKGDDETLFDESKVAVGIAQEALETELAKKDYVIRVFDAEGDELRKHPELKTELSRLRQKYETLLGDVENHYVRNLKWKEFELSLGDAVNQFADIFDADLLVFATGAGLVKSGGEVAKSLTKTALIAAASLGTVVYIENSFAGQVHVSLIDGDNGDFLWHNFSNPGMAYNFTKVGGIERSIRDALKPLPARKSFERIGAEDELGSTPELQFIGENEADADGEGSSRRKVNIPYEATKVVAKTGAETGRVSADVTWDALKATANLTQSATKATFNLMTLGHYRMKKGNTVSAIKAYEAVVKKEKNNPWAYIALGEAYREAGEFRKAEKSLKKSIALDPSIPDARKLLVDVYEQLGKPKLASKQDEFLRSLQAAEMTPEMPLAPAA